MEELLELSSLVFEGLFYLLMLVFVIHTLILAYHWFNYGTSRSSAFIALVIYLAGGLILFLTMGVTMITIF